MDGIVADLKGVCDLAEKYDALVMVDDSHATGFIGKTGRGTHEANDVIGRVDIITSTLGKALGGALGGFTSGKKKLLICYASVQDHIYSLTHWHWYCRSCN